MQECRAWVPDLLYCPIHPQKNQKTSSATPVNNLKVLNEFSRYTTYVFLQVLCSGFTFKCLCKPLVIFNVHNDENIK